MISIHALLAESDGVASGAGVPVSISIHALLAESDNVINSNSNFTQKFLSTLSLRRATVRVYELVWGVSISIHALLAESDNMLV